MLEWLLGEWRKGRHVMKDAPALIVLTLLVGIGIGYLFVDMLYSHELSDFRSALALRDERLAQLQERIKGDQPNSARHLTEKNMADLRASFSAIRADLMMRDDAGFEAIWSGFWICSAADQEAHAFAAELMGTLKDSVPVHWKTQPITVRKADGTGVLLNVANTGLEQKDLKILSALSLAGIPARVVRGYDCGGVIVAPAR